MGFLSFGILVYQHLDKVKRLVLDELNANLNAKVSVDHIDIQVFSNFPEVSFSFKGLSVTSPIPGDSFLVKDAKAYLGFNALQMLQGNYTIQSFELNGASVHLKKLLDGTVNWNIVKEQIPSSGKSSEFKLSLKRIRLSNCRFSYLDAPAVFYTNFDIGKASLSGDFSESSYSLAVDAGMLMNQLRIDNLNILQNKSIDIQSSMDVNDKKFVLGKTKLLLDKLPLEVKGFFGLNTNKQIELNFNSPGTTITQLLSLLPIQLPATFNEFKATGKTTFKGSFVSNPSVQKGSSLAIEFGIQNGSLKNTKTGLALQAIELEGNWKGSIGGDNQSVLSLRNVSGKLEKSRFSGNAEIQLGQLKKITTQVQAFLDLQEIQNWYPANTIKTISGSADLNLNLELKPVLETGSWALDFGRSSVDLGLNASRIELQNSKKLISELIGKAQLQGKQLVVSNLSVKSGSSDIQGSARLEGLFDSNASPLIVKLQSRSSNLDVSDFMGWPSFGVAADSSKTTTARAIELELDVQARTMKQDKFQCSDFGLTAIYASNELEIQELSFKAWAGRVSAKGSLTIGTDHYSLVTDEQIKGVRVKQLLQEFDDFGQNAIKSSHIDGTLNGKFRTRLVWDSKFNFLTKEFYALGELEWKEGRLFNYTPLYALSGFLDLNDLRDLRFQEMKNVIEIKNEVVSIPEMAIKTNAIGLLLSGTHTFGNVLDYRMKVTLSELLNRKRKVKPNEFGESEEGGSRATLMLRIKGPADKLVFTYDKQALGEKVKETVKEEKKAILSTLKNELSVFKDSTIKENNSKNNNHEELEFNPD